METPGCAAACRELEIEIASFLDELGAAGYVPHGRAHRRSILLAFARWTRDKRLAVADLGEVQLARFLKRRSRGPETRKKERATIRRFFAHLRRRGLLPPPISPTSPVEDLAERHIAYLRRDRGLAENSILIYAPCARAFLAHRVSQGMRTCGRSPALVASQRHAAAVRL